MRGPDSAATEQGVNGTGGEENQKGRSMEPGMRRAYLSVIISGVLLAAVLVAGGIRSAEEKRSLPMETAPPRIAETVETFARDRNTLRESELETLKEIAADRTAPEEIRSEANRRRMELMAWMEQEAAIEQVLSARGYVTPVVTVHSDSVNVVVQAERLTRTEAGIILELVTRETGVTGGNVKIIPIN